MRELDIKSKINNTNNEFGKIVEELKQELNKLEDEIIWETLSSNSMPFNIDEKNGFVFDIRTKESNHNVPHFHVKKGEHSGSYSIVQVNKLCGNFNSRQNKYIIEWAEQNKNLLVEKWNSIHENKQV